MFVRKSNFELYLFEAPIPSSDATVVLLSSWNDFVKKNFKFLYQKIVYRKLTGPRSLTFNNTLGVFIKKHLGIPCIKYFKKLSKTAEEESYKDIYCAELIARCFKQLGVIDPSVSTTALEPDFDSNKPIKEYNLDPKRDKPMTTLEICGFSQPEFESNTFYAYGRNFFLECSYDTDTTDNSKEDYETINSLVSKDFFVDDNSYANFVKGKGTRFGRTKCKSRPGLDFTWCEFSSREGARSKSGSGVLAVDNPKNKSTSGLAFSKAIQAIWRCFYGYITSFKVVKARVGHSVPSEGTKQPESDLDMFSSSSGELETVALFTGNDGFLRILSLAKHEYIKVISYGSGGLNNLQLNAQRDLMALATQDDSVLVIDLKHQTVLKISTHSSFVTYLNFFPELNKAMQRRKMPSHAEVQRIMACSMDGSLSVIDFKRSLLANSNGSQLAAPEMLNCTINLGSDPANKDAFLNHISIDDMVIQTVEREVSEGRNLFVKHFKLPMTDTRFGFASGKISDGLMMLWLIEKGINIYECKITPQGIRKLASPEKQSPAKPS